MSIQQDYLEWKHENSLDQEEYETRVLVFKCDLNSSQLYGLHHSVNYAFRCFKGTHKEFDEFCNKHLPNEIIVPTTIYKEQSMIDNVDSCSGNIGVDRNESNKMLDSMNSNKELKRIKEEKRYLKSGF